MIWVFCCFEIILSTLSQEMKNNTLYFEANQALEINMEGLDRNKQFVVMQKIGKGSYADVYKCRDLSDGNCYALKFSNIEMSKYLRNEAYFYQQNPSEYIIKYYGIGRIVINGKIYVVIILELGMITVQDYIMKKDLSRCQILIIIKQVLDGLKFIHSNNYIYNDLKLNNLIFTDPITIKFLDFGLCSYNFGPLKIFNGYISDKEQSEFTYIAPEVRNNSYYNKKADMWSVGALIWSIYTKEVFRGSVDTLRLDSGTNDIVSFLLTENHSIRPTIDMLFLNSYFDEIFTCLDNFSYISDFNVELENSYNISKRNNVLRFKTEKLNFYLIHLDWGNEYYFIILNKLLSHYLSKNKDFTDEFSKNFYYSKYIGFFVGFDLSGFHLVTQLDFKSLHILETLMYFAKNIEYIENTYLISAMKDLDYIKNFLEYLEGCRNF